MDKVQPSLDLESLAIRLMGLPKFLASTHKKDRKWGQTVMEHLRPRLAEIVDEDAFSIFNLDIEMRDYIGPYLNAIEKRDYARAQKIARQFLSCVRDKTQRTPMREAGEDY